jgi:hypothetical protein
MRKAASLLHRGQAVTRWLPGGSGVELRQVVGRGRLDLLRRR